MIGCHNRHLVLLLSGGRNGESDHTAGAPGWDLTVCVGGEEEKEGGGGGGEDRKKEAERRRGWRERDKVQWSQHVVLRARRVK